MNNNYQDSLKINTEINTGTELSLPRPVLQAIPETPKQHLSKQTRVVPQAKSKVYQATRQDSLYFNLIVSAQDSESIYQQNLAWDFLHPLKLTDREWIGQFSESEEITRPEVEPANKEVVDSAFLQKDEAELVRKPDNVTLVVDSLSGVAKEQIEVVKEEVVSVQEDSLSTSVGDEDLGMVAKGKFIPDQYKDVISGLLILSVAILGFLRMTNYKYLRELFSSVVFRQDARKMQKAINLRNQVHSYVLELLFLFNTSLFVYEAILYYRVNTAFNHKLIIVPVIMLGILIYGFVKMLLYKFVGYVFEKEEQTKEYVYYNNLHSKVFGLLILPIALVVPYIDIEVVPVLIKIGIGIFILLYIMQIFRGIVIILKNLSSFFYMFLYLCALEILPLIILYQLIII